MRKARDGPRKKPRKKSNFDSTCLTIPSFWGYCIEFYFCTNLFTVLHREQEIRAAEERLMLNDAPRTADEFEKLVRGSPNSSFLWIKYMALMLSLADIEKARSIAERY